MPRITKVADVKSLVAKGRVDPAVVFPEIARMAASEAWQTREVAATALVGIAKRHAAAVLSQAKKWARSADPNVRRTASEGLRGLVKDDPEGVRTVLELLREDPDLYVRKSVANVLRNASARHPDFVLRLCREWSRSSQPATAWIVRNGLKKLAVTHREAVVAIVGAV
jgi:3-methyladenine DNA glycosylase AlkC